VRNLNSIGKKPLKKACSHHIDYIYVHAVKEDRDRGYVNILGCDRCGQIIGPETDFEVVLPPLS
jgi:hypothetical protein